MVSTMPGKLQTVEIYSKKTRGINTDRAKKKRGKGKNLNHEDTKDTKKKTKRKNMSS